MALGKRKPKREVIGWQAEVIYLGGDPYNPAAAPVSLMIYDRHLVLADTARETAFTMLTVPYTALTAVEIADAAGATATLQRPADDKALYETIAFHYTDDGAAVTVRTRVAQSPVPKQNADVCRQVLRHIMRQTQRNRGN